MLDQGDTPVGRESYDDRAARGRRGAAVLRRGRRRAKCAARSPPSARPAITPSRTGRWGSACSPTSRSPRGTSSKSHGVGKVAIVDFDVHHGNGTQAAFEDDPTVLFISLHQDPRTLYPGSGHEWETGVGPGEGFTLNIPFSPGADDDDYLHADRRRRCSRSSTSSARSSCCISAGFDAHRDDPLAQIELSEEGFERMTRLLVDVADRHCGGRVVSALEGGYNLRALGRSVVRHCRMRARSNDSRPSAVSLRSCRSCRLADPTDCHYVHRRRPPRPRLQRPPRPRRAAPRRRADRPTRKASPPSACPTCARGGVGLVCATIFCPPAIDGKPGYRDADEAHADGAGAARVVPADRSTRADALVRDAGRRPAGGSDAPNPVHAILLLEGADPIRTPDDVATWFDAGRADRRPRVEAHALRRRHRRARAAHARGRRARPRARPPRHHPRRLAPGRGIVLATAGPGGRRR